jgi:hypothetical protein
VDDFSGYELWNLSITLGYPGERRTNYATLMLWPDFQR